MEESTNSSARKDGTGKIRAVVSGVRVRTLTMVLLTMFMLGAGMGVERFLVAESAVGSQQRDELADLESFETLEQVYAYIREYYVLSDDISDEELIWGAASGMMDALGDEGHSVFLNPTEAEEYRESQSGEFVGIGIRSDTTVSPPQVVFPYEGSPAFEAGLMPKDEILAVDGVPYTEFTDGRAFLDTIAGDEGTDVELELRHQGDVDSYTVTITRSTIKINTVSWAMLPDNVMWIRISSFEEGTGADFEQALIDGKEAGAESLLFDLRGNPGGLIVEELSVISEFLEPGSIVAYDHDYTGEETERTVDEPEGEWREGPVVILIDRDTVSAAEVTASALVENDRAIAVGETTFGTGTSIMPIDLPDGSMIMMGYLYRLTPDGNDIWHVGFDPNIQIINEPGVGMSLPYLYDGELDEEAILATNDDQLIVGFYEAADFEP
jgi:carboxyl-terminal processing protease